MGMSSCGSWTVVRIALLVSLTCELALAPRIAAGAEKGRFRDDPEVAIFLKETYERGVRIADVASCDASSETQRAFLRCVARLSRPSSDTEPPPGTPDEERAAAGVLRVRADRGDRRAQYELGRRYMSGRGVELDEARGLEWLTSAASANEPDAEYELGRRYLRGDGVGEDRTKAIFWLHFADSHGQPAARALLDIALSQQQERSEDLDRARAKREKESGYARAAAGTVGSGALEFQQRVAACQSRCPLMCPPASMYDSAPDLGCVSSCESRCTASGGF